MSAAIASISVARAVAAVQPSCSSTATKLPIWTGIWCSRRSPASPGFVFTIAPDTAGVIQASVIARDPALDSVTPDDGDDWQKIQEEKLQLSNNAELVIATGSGHDVPHVRPDVIIAAVRKLVAQASGTGGHPGNSLR